MVSQRNLDFLRGIAAVIVLVNHTRGAFFVGGEKLLTGSHSVIEYAWVALLQLTSFGTEAVVLFFVLSGFAMAHSVRLSRSTSRFYLKRVIRIWPPYLAATVMAVGLAAIVGRTDLEGRFWQIAFYWNPNSSMTPQFWSLPYEVIFYLLCPVLLADKRRVGLVFSVASLMFFTMAVFIGLTINPHPWVLVNFFGNELFLFASGAMAYHYFDRIPDLPGWKLVAIGVVALVLAWVTRRMLGQVNVVSMIAIGGLSILLLRNLPERDWGRINFGSFSYSLYIYHYALIAFALWIARQYGVVGGDITNPAAWMIAVPPIMAICFALYWVTERPCNQLLERLRR